MLFFYFFIASSFVIYSALRVTKYVSGFNEKTAISAGFIGVVLFSTITSLPELLTSVYSVILGQPTMAFGNVMGSNVFNIVTLSIANLFYFKENVYRSVDKDNKEVTFLVIVLNIITLAGMYNPITISFIFFNISLASLAIFIIYAIVLFRMYKAEEQEHAHDAEPSGLDHLTLEQVIMRGLLFVAIMVVASIFLTRISDGIATAYPEIGATVVGTLMLALATSLPEVVTTLSLCKMKHHNMAIAGIVGSNLFNYNNLFIADLLSIKQSAFELVSIHPDITLLKSLGVLGLVVSTILLLSFLVKNKAVSILGSITTIVLYVIFIGSIT